MKRKSSAELEKSGNRAAAKRRRAEEALEGVGEPVRPQGLAPATRKSWRKLVKEYAAVLVKSDGGLLLELVNARAEQYTGALSRRDSARKRVTEIEAVFASRTPVKKAAQIDAPKAAEESESRSLQDFLAATARQRDTFAQRLVHAQTCMLDEDSQAFAWEAGDATTRALEYAQRVVQGALRACDLNKRACARFLNDLERGHERGIFYDPIAARQIVEWFSTFMRRPPYDWQLFVLVNLFGFRLPSGMRRFKECWAWVSRQNGKSSMSSGIGLFCLLCDGEDCAQVYSAATTEFQAGIIFKDAKRAVKKHPDLKEAIVSYRPSLNHEESDSVFQPLASEVSSLDGLRPSALLCDEIHEWQDREQWSKLTSGQVSRTQPLTIAISTAGGVQKGFGFEKYQMVRNILHGVFTAEDIFCCVWELEALDDYRDSSLWIKANPSLGVGLKMDALNRQFRETEQDPSSLSSFLRYQCGRWTEFKRSTATFSFDKIDACRGYKGLPHATAKELLGHFLSTNAGLPSYGGYDYGEVSDLACFALLYPSVKMTNGDVLSNKVLIAEFWTPSATVAQHQKDWGVPLEQWVRDGWVKTCDGDMNDTRQLSKDLDEIINAQQEPSGLPVFNVKSIGYDKFHSRPFMSTFAEDHSVECIEVQQNSTVLTPLAVAFKTAVLTGSIWILDNPVIKWMLGNVILERSGKFDSIVPEKPNRNSKIDSVQAALCAWERMEFLASNSRPPSLYFMNDDGSGVKYDASGNATSMASCVDVKGRQIKEQR